MWWSRKKKQTQLEPKDQWSNRLAGKMNNYVVSKQAKLAGFLNQKTNGLSKRGKKVFLVGFCLLFGGMSLFQIMDTLFGKPSSASSLHPGSISVPQHIDKTGEEGLFPHVRVTEEDMNNVIKFRHYMDSLKASLNGKIIYDSILTARPGLLDTVSMIEKLYILQQKK